MQQIPQATEIETNVLGQIIGFPEAAEKVMHLLTSDCFYNSKNNIIFRCLDYIHKKGNPIDTITVVNELKKNGYLESIGGVFEVAKYTNDIYSFGNIENHVNILLEKKMKRDIINSAISTLNDAYNPDSSIESLVDKHEKSLAKLRDNVTIDETKTMDQLHSELLIHNVHMIKSGGITGVPSGFHKLDKVTGGWQKGSLIILAANPGEGKSALALQLASYPAVKKEIPVGVFSLEMTGLELYGRLQSQQTNIDGDFFTRTGLTDVLISQLSSGMQKAPIYVDDNSQLTVFEFRAKARRLVSKFGVQLIVVDYLQLMSGGNEHKGNREQEISYISRSLKSTAKELGIPIIALSQLSRGNDTSADKRPKLRHLRESGAIEQNANVVLFIYRPFYHGVYTGENGDSTKGIAEIIIAKHRGGSLSTIELGWDPSKTLFSDYQSTQIYSGNKVTF